VGTSEWSFFPPVSVGVAIDPRDKAGWRETAGKKLLKADI
jgi:hypothetical protein